MYFIKLNRNSHLKKKLLNLSASIRKNSDDVYQPVPHYKEKSSLYVPSKNVKNKIPIFPRIFKPEINLKHLFSNTQSLDRNLHQRNVLLNLDKLKNDYLKLIDLQQRMSEFDKAKNEISKNIGKFVKKSKLTREEALKTQEGQDLLVKAQEIEAKIDELNETILPLEEIINIACLRLPNYIHKCVPTDYNHVLFEWNKLDHLKNSNIDLSRDNSIINRWDRVLSDNPNKKFNAFNNFEEEHEEFGSYLSGKYAKLELAIRNYFISRLELLKSPNLEYQKGLSMVKSPIIEGCGYYFNDSRELLNIVRFSSQNDIELLHLCGNSSINSLIVNLANSNIKKSLLPWLIYTDGKSYSPKYGQKSQLNLLALSSKGSSNLIQYDNDLTNLNSNFEKELVSSLNIFTPELNELEKLFTKDNIDILFVDLCKLLIYIYKDLNTRFKLSSVTANLLKTNECYKVALEMFVYSEQKYVTIAEISLIDDFISKRLGIKFKQDKKSKQKETKIKTDEDDVRESELKKLNSTDNISMIHVKLVDINLLMKCLIEANTTKNGTFVMPDVLKIF